MKPQLINQDSIQRITRGIHFGKRRSVNYRSKKINLAIVVALVLGAAFLYHRYLHRTSPEEKESNLNRWISNIQASCQQQQLETYQQYLKQHRSTILGPKGSPNVSPFQQQHGRLSYSQPPGRRLLPTQQRGNSFFGRNGRNIPSYKFYR